MGIFDKFKGQGRHRAGHVSETAETRPDERTITPGPQGDSADRAEAPEQHLDERLTDREHESDRPAP
ncbi:hypothetical protein [Streptomyces jeddahensis]|uniref:Uncharacterized protein n=1 Tax=Streptomyces jeddahensis TaxID=1716141 RepID=A0A177HTD7_9ACTN|nr:hypothetical protein [Streptomyces jeddahensis]OAH14143.1 hypothetical protein STSP_25930 [Streptomyces jeddahensis]